MNNLEEECEVEVFSIDLEEDGEHFLMAYEREGVKCITFAAQDESGFWVNAPFPEHLAECESCLQMFAARLQEEGYHLERVPEQRMRRQ